MKKLLLACAALGGAIASANPAFAAEKHITRELLLKGADAPERREFPLSSTVKPCEDFHRYACEETEKNFKLPADRSFWFFSFMENQERLIAAKRNYFKLLGEGYVPRTKRARQVKDYYLACMDPEAGAGEERSFVAEQKAKMEKITTREELAKVFGESLLHPDYGPAVMGAVARLDDPNYYDIAVAAAGLTLPERSYYEDPAMLDRLRELATAFFAAAGLDKPEERAKHVVEFEQGFAKASPPIEVQNRRYDEARYIERGALEREYPQLSWKLFLKAVPAKVKIRNAIPETMRYVADAMASLPVDAWKDIYLFQQLKDTIDDSNPEYFKKYFEFQRALGGPAERPVREKRCVEATTRSLGMELDEDLLPILFPKFPAARVEKLAERVRTAIIKGLKENEWLTPAGRAEAIKKMEHAQLELVKPKRVADWNFLPERKYDAKKPLTNERLVQTLRIERQLERRPKKRNRSQWFSPPLTVNAYYEPSNNSFTLPQGILQPPFFDEKMKDHQLLGAIGTVIGHELGHGIDDSGSKYDWQGRLRTWKAPADEKEFEKRSERFVKLFEEMGHNGKLTLGENIGDHEGVTFAFAAAFPKPATAPVGEVKDFFLSFARLWCAVGTPEATQRRLKSDEHALFWARINGQVRHLGAFQEAFGCKEGDAMYLPEAQRIRIW